MRYYFITGTSSGLGKALAEGILQNDHSRVIGIARRNTLTHPNYTHVTLDLSNTRSLLEKISGIFNTLSEPQKITLINNAGMLGQVGYVGNIEGKNIDEVFKVNVIAPGIIMNAFINKYRKSTCVKTIVNISSGAGKRAVDGWAWYCASKSALDMYTQVAVEEEKFSKNNFNIFSVAPGIVDTDMQEHIRNTSPQHFSRLDEFKSLKKEGKLLSPRQVAEKFLYLLENESKFQSGIISVKDFHLQTTD